MIKKLYSIILFTFLLGNISAQNCPSTCPDLSGTSVTGFLIGSDGQTRCFYFGGICITNFPAPVEFGSFDGHITNKKAVLNWTTYSEVGNKGFEIEKSRDGSRYSSIGFVNGNGDSNELISYRFIDEHPMNGLNFYRLKQIDNNGEYEYSDVISMRYDIGSTLSVAPNPVTLDGLSSIFIYSEEDASGVVSIYNLAGQLINFQTLQLVTGQNHVDVSSDVLSSGVYFLNIQIEENIKIERLVVQ